MSQGFASAAATHNADHAAKLGDHEAYTAKLKPSMSLYTPGTWILFTRVIRGGGEHNIVNGVRAGFSG